MQFQIKLIAFQLLVNFIIFIKASKHHNKYINELISDIQTSRENGLLTSQINSDSEVTIEQFRLLINRFDQVLGYLEEHDKNVNLDGLYGIRIAQGTLQSTFNEFQNKVTLGNTNSVYIKIMEMVKNFLKRIDELSENVLKTVKTDAYAYYKQFSPLIDGPFVIKPVVTANELKLLHEGTENESFLNTALDEDSSDKCYSKLLGTSKENKECTTSDECLKYYTEMNTSRYYLTHQFLFFFISKKVNFIILLKKNFF